MGALPEDDRGAPTRPTLPPPLPSQENHQEAASLPTDPRRKAGSRRAGSGSAATTWEDADPPATWEDYGRVKVPLGFNLNRGKEYVPLQIPRANGTMVPAAFTKVIWSEDPLVCGMLEDDTTPYFEHLHATPCYSFEPVRNYHQDQVEFLQRGHPLQKDFDEAVQWEGDLSLKAELHRFREKVRMIKAKREEVKELEDDIWKLELGRVGSLRRLTGAQILKRVERANKGKLRELMQEYKRRRGRRS